jgi:hypothetical protein
MTTTIAPKTNTRKTGRDREPIDLGKVRRVGFSARPHRVRRNLLVYTEYLRPLHPDASEQELAVLAAQLHHELEQTHPHAAKAFEQTAPTSRCPARRGLMSLPEVAAMRGLPHVQMLEAELERYCGGTRKRNPALPRAILNATAGSRANPRSAAVMRS